MGGGRYKGVAASARNGRSSRRSRDVVSPHLGFSAKQDQIFGRRVHRVRSRGPGPRGGVSTAWATIASMDGQPRRQDGLDARVRRTAGPARCLIRDLQLGRCAGAAERVGRRRYWRLPSGHVLRRARPLDTTAIQRPAVRPILPAA
eukprot:scaffold10998_cov112-Isochrysis_galbana.AAC.3